MTIPLDGNAIGGALIEFFGSEMTDVSGTCIHCGTVSQIAELAVYMRAPGAVVRCRTCGSVVMVLVSIHEQVHVDVACFALSGKS
ncbi:MAG: DUF6510 family protein [Solirubrobacteraceae bacterium]